MSHPRATVAPLILLFALAPWGRSATRAQEAPTPPAAADSEARAEELVERYREAERELDRLRRELLERSRKEAHRSREQRERLLAELARAPRVWGGDGPYALLSGRPRLGITLRTEGGHGAPADGAVVDAVLDGGPADEAGLRPGDVITRWNDESLAGDAGSSEAKTAAPAMRLIDLARQLEDGQEVRLTYRRDGKSSTVGVTARELGPPVLAGGLDEARALELDEARAFARQAERLARVTPRLPEPLVLPWLDNRFLDGIELVPLNPGLGEYFGTESGLLVLTAPADGPLGLRAGDVILSIGDREPSDMTHVLRILGSYAEGETVNLHVMRKGKRTVLTATVPERDKARFATPFSPFRHPGI